MSKHTVGLTLLAMLAFAANSLLCRLALKGQHIDAASFTAVRILAGAVVLGLIVTWRGGRLAGNWPSALALFAYAACFSFSYLSLSAATGALLLFGAVQASMLAYGCWRGERLSRWQGIGLVCALAGLAWGIYSLRGRGQGDSTEVTAGNFLRATLFAALLVPMVPHQLSGIGLAYAIASGGMASGLGYAIWYTALRELRASSAATVQLSVPIFTALGGILFLDEALTLRLILASLAMLGGIALVILAKPARPGAARLDRT